MNASPDDIDRFVDAWGDLGVVWGIPRTTSRIQALLLAVDGPLALDDITDRLGISKGGASDRLKQLREWGVVQRVSVDGDRRDFHLAPDDVWSAFVALIRARKEAEFDPVAKTLRSTLSRLRVGADGASARRLEQAGEILEALDGVGERLLHAGPATRAVLRFLTGVKLPT